MQFLVHSISGFIYLVIFTECAASNYSTVNVNNANTLNNNGVRLDNTTVEGDKNSAFLIDNFFLSPDLRRLKTAIGSLPDGICKNDSEAVLQAILKHETWALKMFDSSPKFPVGTLYGSHYQLGNFDECIGVETVLPHKRILKGQYCIADVALQDKEGLALNNHQYEDVQSPRIVFNNTLHWAICIPSTCSSKELEIVLNKLLNGVASSTTIKASVPELRCYFEEDIPFKTSEIVYGCIIGAFVVFVLLATAFHIIQIYCNQKCSVYNMDTKKNSRLNVYYELLVAFSLVKSIEKLLNTDSSETSLNCIFGIKAMSMCLILSSHTLLFLISGPVLNEGFYIQAVTEPQNAIWLNNPLLVDTFLLIGGFLMCKLLLAELDKTNGKVNILGLYAARYIRLTPAYLVVIFCYYTIFIRIDNGPLWKERMTIEQSRCAESWWANILYINNYVNTNNICMFQSWYLAVDTHLFIIAPFIIYVLWKWARYGEVLLGALTILSTLVVALVTYGYNLDPTLMGYPPEITDVALNPYFVFAYIKTHMRAISYCMGLIAAYCLHKLETNGKKLPGRIIWMGWIFAFIFGTASVYSVTIFYLPHYENNALASTAYSSLHKLAWSFSIAWIILACATNNGGPIRRFLSWKPFIPLSRLSYCAYLVNGAIELHSFGTLRSPIYMSIYSVALIVLGRALLTFIAGFILCIFFESPIHSIEKIILSSVNKKTEVQPENGKL